MQDSTDWTNEFSAKIYHAILNDRAEEIKSCFKDKTLIDVPLQTSGTLAGFTALHIACMNRNIEMVRLLINDFHANVNVVANDGAQPIHLACIFGCNILFMFLDILLKAGANADAKISENFFLKYIKGKVWCNDFGYKMTLLTYAILYRNNIELVESLIRGKANFKVKSLKNKTLLMYAIQSKKNNIARVLIREIKDKKWINARDNNGFPATHYLLHPKDLKNKPSFDDTFEINEDFESANLMTYLLNAGADVYALINGDPDTLLLHMAAYRHFPCMISELLPYYHDISKSKALYYVSLPLKGAQTECTNKRRRMSIELIIKDSINRRMFSRLMLEDEKQLMDELIGKDLTIQKLAHSYGIFINDLQSKVLKYGDKSITYYDFIKLCFDAKQLRSIVENKPLIDAFKTSFPIFDDYSFFRKQISKKIERVELFEELEKVENLRKALPLPYELVLMIIEYFNNQDLKNFIKAFYL